MFVVLFEVWPKPERWDEYLEIARLLRPELEQIEGFIDNERFRRIGDESGLLSLSTWRDEKALIRWRTNALHYTRGQVPGRFEIFADYRLRVGEVIADTHPPAGLEPRPTRLDLTEVGVAKVVTITETLSPAPDAATTSPPPPAMGDPVEQARFESIYQPGKHLLLMSWRNTPPETPALPEGVRYRQVRVIREYGMRDRREAPQYFPPVD
ncbi:antibiotic biosynthesis monooxygenase family protein [Sphaerobacter thermophilus]|uniref:Antibiotic biosynthesis monooxygenase n=1 Tax=Sphaerobacter thermophilus (strain ATCC 49802 / DSM 20745 / KCCM 41009 / NCIMB 13125 / S 6022) TaxID=479434 RepID=D1C953_SPHTD|nr:antibiotic biosynthesis monooxygenase family protein [Sphaerobacter thermophilus]ACZ40346.1 Antibiotic biosynthesis monooxygenase [Sphaerobacter thermophilus DSM 20745]PZN66275.1 MAG: antibiotic biosynthesis monooxygenase [Sphaerobacter thermophilus]